MNKTKHDSPKLRAKAVLFDIDNTVVLTRSGLSDDIFEQILRKKISEASRDFTPSPSEENGNHAELDIQAELDRSGIETEEYIFALCDAMKPWVSAFEDAVEAVTTLHARGYRLYPATTNGRIACLAKFTLADLAQGDTSSYFNDLFGGSEVHPSGKTTPEFYRQLLRRIDLNPHEVVMVGDDPHYDCELAYAAGIRQIVLPRRHQTEPIVRESDGGIYVRSLTSLLEMLDEPA